MTDAVTELTPCDGIAGRIEHVLSQLPDLRWAAEEDGAPLWFGAGWSTLTGETQEALLEGGWSVIPHSGVRASLLRSLEAGEAFDSVVPLRLANGEVSDFILSACRAGPGTTVAWIGTCTRLAQEFATRGGPGFLADLSERLRRETDPQRILAEANRALGERLGALRVGYGEIDASGTHLTLRSDWTDGVESNAGTFPLASFGPVIVAENRAGLTFVSPDIGHDPRIDSIHRGAFTHWGVGALVAVPLLKQGRLTAILSVQSALPRAWSRDELDLIEGTAERTWEALERARTEADLRKSEERLRIALEGAELGTWDYDLVTMEGWWSERTCEIYGVPYEESVPADLRFRLVHPNDVERYLREVDEAVLSGRPFTIEYRIVRPDGELRWVVLRGIAVTDASGNPVRATGIALDTTERKLAEVRLAESQALLAAFMENAPVGMYLKDPEGRYTLVNPEMAKVLGVAAQDAIGRTARDILGDEEADGIDEEERKAIEQGRAQVREQFFPHRRDHSSAQLFRFPVLLDDRPARIGGFAIDTTERLRAQAELERSREALHQSEKLTALGSLLAGVAHELNNPLAVVVAHAAMLEEEAEGSAHADDALKIRRAAERCARIVQTFLAMARQNPPERREVDLNASVRAALDLLDYSLRTANVEVAAALDPDLPRISADADQLHQVLANLIANAQQAMSGIAGARRLTVRSGREERGLWIEVSDTGAGIPEAVRHRIFEPYFTTKAQGEGTGIGLSYSHGIVAAHGGTLELLESSASGSTFRLTLPLTAAGPQSAGAAPAEPRAGASGTALVVDDEPDLAEILERMLRREGYHVVTASSGREAQALIAAQTFDLVLTDLRMPDMDGQALFAWIGQERPALAARTAFSTGDTLSPEAARFLSAAGRPFIEKPFSRASLRRLLDRIDGEGG